MSGVRGQTRGRPLATFAAFFGAWVLLRVVTWEPLAARIEQAAQLPEGLLAESERTAPLMGPIDRRNEDTSETRTLAALNVRLPASPALAPDANWHALPLTPSQSPPLELQRPAVEPSVAAGHQLLWAAAMAHLPLPHRLTEQAVSPTRLVSQSPSPLTARLPKRERWSLDAWAFWRQGSDNLSSSASRAPVYGASQAAAVLRYRLAPSNSRDPRAYVRAYKALVTGGESELAAGLSARPLASVPLRAHAELRVTRYSNDTGVRPAAFVTSEIDPIALPVGIRAEVYGQAGYVGGEGKTAFADGQLHLLRELRDFDLGARDRAKVSIGGGAWAGAQKDSSRIDLGPSMRFDLKLGETPARLSVDWRERVSGDAEPDSGVAVTLSTRF